MKYLASSEAAIDVGKRVIQVHECFDDAFAEAIQASSLSEIDGRIIYVPIVMPVEMQERYKERSRYLARSRTYECCPHLEHSIFLHGTLKQALDEYVRGLSVAAAHLPQLGATEAQVVEFRSILSHVGTRVLAEPGEDAR